MRSVPDGARSAFTAGVGWAVMIGSRGADDLPGTGAGPRLGQPPVADHRLSSDERPPDPPGPRHVARTAVGHVVDDLLRVAGDAGGVEDRHVPGEAGREPPAVGDAEDLC